VVIDALRGADRYHSMSATADTRRLAECARVEPSDRIGRRQIDEAAERLAGDGQDDRDREIRHGTVFKLTLYVG
jgi:hypothetical protein